MGQLLEKCGSKEDCGDIVSYFPVAMVNLRYQRTFIHAEPEDADVTTLLRSRSCPNLVDSIDLTEWERHLQVQ